MNHAREHLVTCSPKVKSENVKQSNTVSISEDKPRVSTTLKWLKVTNLLMLLSNSGCLATLPEPVQQQNDRLGKNKSTKLSQPSGQIWKEKARQSIHLTQALCNNYGIGFYFHLKVPLSAVKYKARSSHWGRTLECFCTTTIVSQPLMVKWRSMNSLTSGWCMHVCDNVFLVCLKFLHIL